MGRRRTVNKGFPPHLKLHRCTYYFDHGMVGGKRKYESLGDDYPKALRRWAEITGEPETRGTTWGDASRRYRRERLHKVAPATQGSYTRCLDALDKVFADESLDAITAEIAGEYLRRRSVKREIRRCGVNGPAERGPIWRNVVKETTHDNPGYDKSCRSLWDMPPRN